MAVYKVPQDVEADDKLLGPFSFRQFIYLIVVALAIGMAWLLAQIFIGLVIIPLPVIIFFGALALPLKKDQPMEAYLGAMISFYFLRPRKRLWVPDGLNSLVEITAPRIVEPDRMKDITGSEARERLGYLTDIVESRGWSVRGSGVPMPGATSVNSTMMREANATVDMFDNADNEAQKFDRLIKERRQNTIQTLNTRMQPNENVQSAQHTPQKQATPHQQPKDNVAENNNPPPIPKSQNIHQTVSSTQSTAAHQKDTTQNTSNTPSSPAIIKLAKESDGLTVSDVAYQAHRISENKNRLPEEEVQISLH